MAGSMRLKRPPDVWELRVFVGRDTTGHVRHRQRTFRGSRRQAERELARLVAEQDSLVAPPLEEEQRQWGPATTINQAIAGWRDNGWQDLSPKTRRGYEDVWSRFVKSSIGQRRIASVGPYEVERFFRRLKDDGMKYSQLRQVRALLHRSCKLAAKWSGGAFANPVSMAEMPTYPHVERGGVVRAASIEEVKALLGAAETLDERMAVYLRVIAATGMRRGEAAALRWDDVDLPFLRVDESVLAAVGGARVKEPKTRASIRTVTLDAGTSERVAEWRVRQQLLADAIDGVLAERSFVFGVEPPFDTPPHPDAFSTLFARVRKKAGVASDIHLHSLRHFQATVLDAVISERQKQARLGWTTSHMARHYTDPVNAEDERAAQFVGTLLDTPR
jgi:integrase